MAGTFKLSTFLSGYEFHPTNALLAAIAAVASYLVMHAVLSLCRKRLARLSEERAHKPFAEVLQKTLAATSNVTVIVTALLIGLALLELPYPWNDRARHLWFIGIGLQLALYLHQAISIAVKRYFRSHARPTDATDSVAHTLVMWAFQSTIWIVLALAVLANLGINVSTFVASLGIGGIAVALAVQNILGDLFASLSIAVDKPFEVGDAISVAGFSGTVEHVGLKTTRVRSDSGEQIVIANSELLKETVRNFKRMTQRRVQFTLRVDPSTPAAIAQAIPPRLRQLVESQDKVRFDRAHLKSIDQNALEFEVVYFVLDPGFALHLDRQLAILLGAMNALAELNVSMSLAPQPVLVRRQSEQAADAGAETGATERSLRGFPARSSA